MADAKQFQILFQIQALDRATAVIQGVRNNLLGVGQAAKQLNADSAGAGSQLAQGLQQARIQAEELQKKLSDVGMALGQAGLALAGAGAAMLAPLALSVRAAGSFEAEMNKVKAVAEATPEEFKKMSDFAREMGKTMYSSATQAASGMLDLSRAGYKTEEVLSTLPTVLKLAAVEGLNTGQVSENLVRIMSAFGLVASDAARVGDVLARTANDTVTSMGGLAEGLKFAAPVARAVGMTIEETAAYLGTLAQNGLDATMAGTGLRRIMAVLMDPTNEAKEALYALNVEIAKNADGSLNLQETLLRLKNANMSAADAFKIFGVWGSTAALGLTQQFDFLTKLIDRNQKAVGDLGAMADTSLAGFNAAVNRLGNSLNEMMIAFGTPFLNVLTGAANAISSFLNWISKIAESVPGLSFVLGSVAGVVGILLGVFGALALAAGALVLGVSALSKGWLMLTNLKWQNIAAVYRSITAHSAETAAIVAKTQAVNTLTAALSAAARVQAAHTGAARLPTGPAPIPNAGRLGGMGIPLVGGLLSGMTVGTPGTVGGNLESMGFGALSGGMFGGLPGAIIGAGVASWYKVLTKDLWDLLDVWGLWERKREKSATAMTPKVKPLEATQEKAEPRKPLQEQLNDIKNYYELQTKLLDVGTKKKETNLKIEEEAYKAQVASDIASAWLREQSLEAAELSFAAKRIQISRQNHDEFLALKEDEYLKSKAILEEQAKDPTSEAGKEAVKKLGELETKHAEVRLQAEKKLTEEIAKEIEKQYQKRAEHSKKIVELEQQMKEAQVEGFKALADIFAKATPEAARVETQFRQMEETLRRAAEALPTMPEKAIQLAQQAGSMASGLVADINAMKQSYVDFARSSQEGLLGIQKRGMQPIQAWYADIGAYETTVAQARQAQAAGQLEEAQKLAAAAAQKAQGLANAPEGVSQEQAVQLASQSYMDAVRLEGSVRREIIAREEARQQRAEEAARERMRIEQEARQQQVEALKQQITTLDKNTEALLQLKAAIEGKKATPQNASSAALTATEPAKQVEAATQAAEASRASVMAQQEMPKRTGQGVAELEASNRAALRGEPSESEQGQVIGSAASGVFSFGLGRLKDWLAQATERSVSRDLIRPFDMAAIAEGINARRQDMAARARQTELDRMQTFYSTGGAGPASGRAGIGAEGETAAAALNSGATVIQQAGGMFKEAVTILREVLGDVRITVNVEGSGSSSTTVEYP
jgi:TP901 family phage tail tape measure protein